MANEITLYFFKIRDPLTGKWYQTGYRLELHEAKQRFGERNCEVIESSKEVRAVTVDGNSAAHLYR